MDLGLSEGQRQQLAHLKLAEERKIGKALKWADSADFGGSSWADIPDSTKTVSIMVDPPEGQDQVKIVSNGQSSSAEDYDQSSAQEDYDQDTAQNLALDLIAQADKGVPGHHGKSEMTALGAVFTGTLTWDEWYGDICALFRLGKAIFWNAGDYLVIGEAEFGEQYAQAFAVAEALDYSVNTVQQWKSIAGRIPRHERTEDLPYSGWRYLASKTPAQRKAGKELLASGLTVSQMRETLEDGEQQSKTERPPCPICGGETTQSRCKSCSAGYSAVAWHFADTTPLERARRQPEVNAALEALEVAARQLEHQAKLWELEAACYEDAPGLKKNRLDYANGALSGAMNARAALQALEAQ